MPLKKLFYKLTNKKYLEYKAEITKNRRLKVLNGLADKIVNIQNVIENKKEISFLHSGHLGT